MARELNEIRIDVLTGDLQQATAAASYWAAVSLQKDGQIAELQAALARLGGVPQDVPRETVVESKKRGRPAKTMTNGAAHVTTTDNRISATVSAGE